MKEFWKKNINIALEKQSLGEFSMSQVKDCVARQLEGKIERLEMTGGKAVA